MGQLIDGVWHDTWYDTKSTGGKFQRSASAFRNWLTADGAPGPTGTGGFIAEKDRYHLYVSLACPWAHRTLIMRKLKGLEPFISVSVVNPLMLENGWTFDDSFPGATGDTLYQNEFLYQLYLHADPHYSGRVTVPVLWDKKNHTIVSNESAEIIRMFNTAFDAWARKRVITTLQPCKQKLTNLTAGFMTPLTTACIKLVLPPARKLTTRRWRKCLNRWHDWSRF
ncbi:putative glutathione S-transferase [Escherichia coli]|nr:putative glutathione S-transferase [Escherichia coli]